MRDVLTFAEQSSRACQRLKLAYSYGIACERVSQEFSRNGFTRPNRHGLSVSDCRPRTKARLVARIFDDLSSR